ncbi:MAG: hypothetical protein K0Q66_509, partial [Chitinophagaceae bacterium]|nr:hypothetical protein [Chitinophagaceae bacterium]
DTSWYNSIPNSARVRQLDSIFALVPVADSVDCSTGGTLNFSDSIILNFPPSFCVAGGSTVPITGKVKVEVIHLNTKGDMVRTDRPTMSYHNLLVTGGAVYLRVTQNGIPVQMAPGKMIQLKIFNKMSHLSPSTNMHVFYGKEDAYPATAAQSFTWIPWTDSLMSNAQIVQNPATSLLGYQFFTNRFGWVNCDYFSDTTQLRTKATVVLPPNFTNANTNVYAVFKSPDIVAQLKADPLNKVFFLPNAYQGKIVTFVTLSYIAGNIYMGTQEQIISEYYVEHFAHPKNKNTGRKFSRHSIV